MGPAQFAHARDAGDADAEAGDDEHANAVGRRSLVFLPCQASTSRWPKARRSWKSSAAISGYAPCFTRRRGRWVASSCSPAVMAFWPSVQMERSVGAAATSSCAPAPTTAGLALPDLAADLKQGNGGVAGYRWSGAYARDIGAYVAYMRRIAAPVSLIGTSRAALGRQGRRRADATARTPRRTCDHLRHADPHQRSPALR